MAGMMKRPAGINRTKREAVFSGKEQDNDQRGHH
jgi:hypothetical protein